MIIKNESTISIFPGDITHYVILRDGQERYRGDENTFTDVGGIRPFQEYNYQLRVCNRAGCTDSAQVKIHVCLSQCCNTKSASVFKFLGEVQWVLGIWIIQSKCTELGWHVDS